MHHGPAVELGVDHAAKRKSRLGVVLFFVYLIVYAGFVAVGVADYTLMGEIVLGNQNLAVVYGFGLIILAIVMGVVYNFYCTKFENKMNKED